MCCKKNEVDIDLDEELDVLKKTVYQENAPIFQKKKTQIEIFDDDIKMEENYVKNTNELSIKVENLRKVYRIDNGGCCKKGQNVSYKVAVKNVTFGIEKGVCFGLLGTNGAGKTTAFKILTGEYNSTKGNVYINGHNCATDMKNIRHLIGYCPQFDALLDKLSSREHLELYAAIKGIPVQLREPMIQKMLKELNLKQFEHVNSDTYSGGNKRKLSVAIALLGNPPIILLDEPSSGMDPEARRFMWSIISNVTSKKKQSSVVLTTHSMEEAEALSTKLAIMVEGNIKCIGSVQSLKDKYGKGFEIEVKVSIPDIEKLKKMGGYQTSDELDLLIKKENIKEFFEKNNIVEYLKCISPNGSANHIHKQIENKGGIAAKILLEFVYVQIEGKNILTFLEENFGQLTILEHFQSFFRFKVESQVLLSKMFGVIEKNKDN